MTIDARLIPGAISNTPLPDHVLVLPPHLQAQPALVRSACQACLVSLVTSSKKGVSDGTVAGLARAFMGASFCARNNTYDVCNPCRGAHKAGCIPVSIATSVLIASLTCSG
jgi:hypothetical protein